jgi:hypothetical protein
LNVWTLATILICINIWSILRCIGSSNVLRPSLPVLVSLCILWFACYVSMKIANRLLQ